MPSSRRSLAGFLATARAALRNAVTERRRVTLVIGNESADLDSITSAILLAYVRTHSPPPAPFSPIYVPLANLPRADLSLRPELLALLPHAGLRPSQLITLDDLPDVSTIGQIIAPEVTQWLLVDHNSFQGSLGSIYAARVGGVIDHHDEEGRVPHDTGEEPRIVTRSGSCSSLVTEYCREGWDALSPLAPETQPESHRPSDDTTAVEEDPALIWDAQVAKLALASILIDTNNLTAEAKTTEHDRSAVAYLEAKIRSSFPSQSDTPPFDRIAFFEEIDAAKRDIGTLSLSDILRKDYKEWRCGEEPVRLGISSVVKDVHFLNEKAGEEEYGRNERRANDALLTATATFAQDRQLGGYGLMTAFTSTDGHFKRELLVWAFGADNVGAAERFVSSSGAELELEEVDMSTNVLDGENEAQRTRFVRLWRQRNVDASRKQVAPLMRRAVEARDLE